MATVFRCAASRNKRDRRAFAGTDWELRTRTYIRFLILILETLNRTARPGLPQLQYRFAEPRGQSWVQLVCRHKRHPRHGPEFRSPRTLRQRLRRSWSRFSVALPLGINGDACPRWTMGWNYPNWLDFSGRSQRGRNEHREIAALRRGWLRPARPKGSQEHGLFVLSATTVCRQRGRDRACEGCSPPRRVVANCATRWVAEAPHNFLNFGLSPTLPRCSAPGRQGRRP